MSLLPADSPRMPKWPFLAGDALLLGLALAIGCYAHNAFAGKPLILIVACVALGAVLATWPFIADYERKQNEALDERQRGLEALAHTITSSAEQISIAAQSLPGMAEAVTKSLKSVEQLPARFQEKMGEVKQRLAEVSDARKDASAAGNERLATTADHIRQAVTELAKFEAAAQKNLAAAGDKLDAKAAEIFKQLDVKIALLAALADKIPAKAAPLPAEKSAPVRAAARKEPEAPAAEPARGEPARLEPVDGLAERVEPVPVAAAPTRPAPAERAVAERPAIVEPIVIETPTEESKAPRKRGPARKEPEAPPSELARPEPVEGLVERVEPARGEPARPELAERAVAESPAIIETIRGEPARPEPVERVEPIVIEAPAEEPKAPRKRAPKKPKVEASELSLDFAASTEKRPLRGLGRPRTVLHPRSAMSSPSPRPTRQRPLQPSRPTAPRACSSPPTSASAINFFSAAMAPA